MPVYLAAPAAQPADPIGYLLPHDIDRLKKGKHATICEGPLDDAMPVYLGERPGAPSPLASAPVDGEAAQAYAQGWNDCRSAVLATGAAVGIAGGG